jgi:hypothetical protein
MEVLGGGGWERALPRGLSSLALGARASAGFGGGGAVETGGGALAKVAATLAWTPQRSWSVGAELGWFEGIDDGTSGRTLQTWIAMRTAHAQSPEPATPATHEWSVALERMLSPDMLTGPGGAVDLLGIKLSRALNDYASLNVQTHTAWGGPAGGYSIGLIGAVVATPARRGLRVGADLLVGTGGGGRISSAGGALFQAVGWLGVPFLGNELRPGFGVVRAFRGELSSPLLELSFSRRFALTGL